MAGTHGEVPQPYKSFVCPTDQQQHLEMSYVLPSAEKMLKAPVNVAVEIEEARVDVGKLAKLVNEDSASPLKKQRI